jgi:transposase
VVRVAWLCDWRIGLEAGPLSQWLYAAMKQAGLAVELLETRHVRKALETMPVKSDRNDARGIAQLIRLDWFRPVHCKSIGAQETRAALTAHKLDHASHVRRPNTLQRRSRGLTGRSTTVFGRVTTPGLLEAESFAGTMDQVRPHASLSALRPRGLDWSASSSSDPIRWRPRADPVQKHDPGDG